MAAPKLELGLFRALAVLILAACQPQGPWSTPLTLPIEADGTVKPPTPLAIHNASLTEEERRHIEATLAEVPPAPKPKPRPAPKSAETLNQLPKADVATGTNQISDEDYVNVRLSGMIYGGLQNCDGLQGQLAGVRGLTVLRIAARYSGTAYRSLVDAFETSIQAGHSAAPERWRPLCAKYPILIRMLVGEQ